MLVMKTGTVNTENCTGVRMVEVIIPNRYLICELTVSIKFSFSQIKIAVSYIHTSEWHQMSFVVVCSQTGPARTSWWTSSYESMSTVRGVQQDTFSLFHMCLGSCLWVLAETLGPQQVPFLRDHHQRCWSNLEVGWLIFHMCLKSRTEPYSLLCQAMVLKWRLVDWLSHFMPICLPIHFISLTGMHQLCRAMISARNGNLAPGYN